MSKAEKFIIDSTKNYSNEKRITIGNFSHWGKQPWLTPDDARKAVEIAREEIIEKGIEFLKDHLEGYDIFGSDIERSVESFKLAMEDE